MIVVGGGQALPFALATFESRDLDARWGISSFDSPLFLEENPESLYPQHRVGMVGLGFDPSVDVASGRGPAFPDPTNATQRRCTEILAAAGVEPWEGADPPPDRADWRRLLQLCDSTLFLAAALDQVGPGDEVSAQDFAAGVSALGDTLPSATALGSAWGTGRYAGVDTVRPLRWDESCECFDYFGAPITLPDPSR